MKKRLKYKKYKNIYLILLVIFTFVLDNYNENVIKNLDNNDGEKFSYFVNSYKYTFDKEYIYVGDDTDLEIISSINLMGGTVKIEDDMLRFYNWDYILDEFTLVRLDLSNFIVSNNTILLDSMIKYNDFISNIRGVNTNYKVFKNDREVTSGYITPGMVLKVYYNDNLVDSYNIIVNNFTEYLDMDKLNIKDNKYIIVNVSNVNSLVDNIDTSGNIFVYDKDNNLLENDDNLVTGFNLQIELSNDTYSYTIVVLGDVTGSGNIFIGDISKLYQYYKDTIEMDMCYVIAGDVTYDGVIEINDISKLYQYYKGTIDSL